MNAENLKNAMIFLERASATGKECFAWVQTYQALTVELQLALAAVPQPPVKE